MTMALLAHDGLLRYSELKAIRGNDIKVLSDTQLEVTVRLTKNTHTTAPEVFMLEAYCF